MRRILFTLAATGLVLIPALTGWAGGGESTAIIDKAIKAHFPKGLDTKNQGVRSKNKGTLHVQGLDLEPEQYKHYLLKAIPERLHSIVDVTGFGPSERDDDTRAIAEYNERVASHPQLLTTIVPLRDGVSISVKRS